MGLDVLISRKQRCKYATPEPAPADPAQIILPAIQERLERLSEAQAANSR